MTLSYLVDASRLWDYFVMVPCQQRVFGRQDGEMNMGAARE